MQHIIINKTNTKCSYFRVFLSFIWLASIIIGLMIASRFKSIPHNLVIAVVNEKLSILALALLLIVPANLVILAVRFRMPWFIYGLFVLKGIIFGFSIFSFLIVYIDAGWLLCILSMFSSTCSIFPLIFFCFRYYGESSDHFVRDAIILVFLSVLIGGIDYYVISPFLLTLI